MSALWRHIVEEHGENFVYESWTKHANQRPFTMKESKDEVRALAKNGESNIPN